jgi:ParB family chromosome partitioning protein
LSALLGDAEAVTAEALGDKNRSIGVQEIPIELLRRNPDQPRRTFGEQELDELAASIKDRGIIQPLVVRPVPSAPGEYQIIAGERRWRASQKAGLRSVPALVRSDLDDLDLLEIGIIENVQREDLKPLEEAQAYRTLMERFGRTQEEVSQTVGKSRSHVANALRLLTFPEVVQQALDDGRLSAGHARAIANSPDADRLTRMAIDRDLSVRQVEALARERSGRAGARPQRRPGVKSSDTQALEQDLADTLGLTVSINDKNGRGEVRIAYESLEQLDALCRKLSGV